MPSKHPSQPAASFANRTDDPSGPASPDSPQGVAPQFEEEEKTTVPATRRAAKYLKVLIPHAACVVKVFDDEE